MFTDTNTVYNKPSSEPISYISGLQAALNTPSGATDINGLSDGYTNSATNSTGLGISALASNSGYGNTGVGKNALKNTTTGGYLTAVGSDALQNNTTGQFNTAVGLQTLNGCTTGLFNTAVGVHAGMSLPASHYSTMIGQQSGSQITSGSGNTLLGRYNGNQGGLDIRSSSGNNIVLSDGAGNPRVHINNAGVMSVPKQPAFYAYGGTAWTDIPTGDTNPGFTLESFDRGNNYNTSTKRFTAPIAGLYHFHAWYYMNASNNQNRLKININGVDKFYTIIQPITPGAHSHAITGTFFMNAGDWCEPRISAEGTGSWYNSLLHSGFIGHLVS